MNEGGKSIIGALLAIAILGAVVVGAVTIFGKDSGASAKSDVTIQACQADPAGGKPSASGNIVNGSSKTSNYVIRLKFKDAQGNQVSEGVNAVRSVKVGANATWRLLGSRKANGPVQCEVTGVSRTHLPGQ